MDHHPPTSGDIALALTRPELKGKVARLEAENLYLWRAIDILVQVVMPSHLAGEYWRDEWEKLVQELVQERNSRG